MQLVVQPDAFFPRPRVSAFPAPLCQGCNVPMRLNGEYRASDDSAARREFQCSLCGCGKLIRRSRRAA